MIKIKTIAGNSLSKKQQGATLFTALVFLILMTLVSVTAAKISMVDVLVSGNNQQQMMLYQQTSRELDDHARPAKLIKLLQENNGEDHNYLEAWGHEFPVDENNPHVKEKITNRIKEYGCGAINNRATSQGSANSCRLYDFEVKAKRSNADARDRHVRGAGKQYPTSSRNNFNRR